MKNTIPSVEILVFKDSQVLLVREGEKSGHLTGIYGLPGGRFNEGESEKQVAVRELDEETGLQVKEEDLIVYPNNVYYADIERKDGTVKNFSMIVYIAQKYEGDLKSNDQTEPYWIEIDKLSTYNLLPNCEKAIRDGLNFLKS